MSKNKTNLKTLREKDVKDLQKQVVELNRKIIEVTPRLSVGEVKDLKTKRKLRVQLAQILGIIREKEGRK